MARSKVWTGSVWAYEDDVVSSENTFKPVIDVTAPIGTSITVSNGSIGFTRTSTETTTRFDIPSWGTWTASATIDGETITKTVEVDTVKIYGVNIGTVPSAYQEVAWIGSSGTQYIDTGVANASGVYVEAKIKYDSLANYVCLMGCQVGRSVATSGAQAPIIAYGNTGNYGIYAGYAGSSSGIQIDTSSPQIIKSSTVNGNAFINVDGTTYTDNSQTDKTRGNKNLYLFAMNDGGSPSFYASGRIYSLKLFDDVNGALVRKFVPCYRISDNEPGLYDLENDVFYTNQGSGIFNVGPDVNQGGNV